GNENPIGMVLKMDHVEQADVGHGGTKKIRPLGQGRPHQQAAVTSALNRQSRGAGIAAIDEELSTGQEIIEDILLVNQIPATMPVFPELASPPQIGNGQHASAVKPYAPRDTEARRLTDAESTVAIKQDGVVAVQCDSFPVHDVERHASAVS